jgi:hypothetical protein
MKIEQADRRFAYAATLRAWLVLPLAYCGGGLALHSVSLSRAHVEAATIE